jgi:hypothetical protein
MILQIVKKEFGGSQFSISKACAALDTKLASPIAPVKRAIKIGMNLFIALNNEDWYLRTPQLYNIPS